MCLVYAHTELRTHWTVEGPEGRVTVPVSGRLMVDHGEPPLQAGLAGMGVLLQPTELVGSAITEGRLVRLLPRYTVPSLH